jgi:hypothetical protein
MAPVINQRTFLSDNVRQVECWSSHKNDEGWAPQAHLRDRRTSGFPLPELGSVPPSGTRDLVVRFDSKANGTGTLRQFVSKATRPKLPGGLLLSPGLACAVSSKEWLSDRGGAGDRRVAS